MTDRSDITTATVIRALYALGDRDQPVSAERIADHLKTKVSVVRPLLNDLRNRRLDKQLQGIEERLANLSGLTRVLLSLHDCPDCGKPFRGPADPGCPNSGFHRPARAKRTRTSKAKA